MKKIIAFILTAVTVFSLSACGSISELGIPEPPKPEETDTLPYEEPVLTPSVQEETDIAAEDETNYSHVIVSVDGTEPEYVYDPDKSDDTDNLILTFLAEKPVVYIDGNREASEKINDFFAYMDEEIATGDDYGIGLAQYPGKRTMTELASDNYTIHVDYNLDNTLEFAFSHTVEVMRCDSSIISFLFTDYVFKGEGTGTYTKYAISFNAETGEPVESGYFKSIDSVRDAINSDFSSKAVNDDKYSKLIGSKHYSDILSGMTDFGNWYIGEDSVAFLVNATEYDDVDNVIYEAELSMADIKDTVSERFPVKVFSGTGNLGVSGDSEFGKTVADMISFSEQGETIFLDINGTIYDVRVSLVQYSDAEQKFFTKSVYWAANYLSDCLLQITADIPDGMPNIRIDFYTGGEYKSLLLSQSGYDGKPILVDSSINAVG